MPITAEQWEYIKPQLVVGCTFRWRDSLFDSDYVLAEWVPHLYQTNYIAVNFAKRGMTRSWDGLAHIGKHHLTKVSDFCFPDGTSMLTNDYHPVRMKSKTLESRAKTTSKYKTKMKSLPFPKGVPQCVA